MARGYVEGWDASLWDGFITVTLKVRETDIAEIEEFIDEDSVVEIREVR